MPDSKHQHRPLYPHDIYVGNRFAYDNPFPDMPPTSVTLPTFADSRASLPRPIWHGHDSTIACYWKAWELAFENLNNPQADSGFVSPFIDTAFNDCIFMWDSAFILMFARYAQRSFNFLGTLDNFYAKQHPDGFICREIRYTDGQDKFFRLDTTSTGPNVLAWVEWQYYEQFGDTERLSQIFPALVAYHQWLREYRTWRDGSYWTSGLGSGMDNQPRVPGGYNAQTHSHAHQVWLDMNLQQILSAKLLIQMADILDRRGDIPDIDGEVSYLERYVNKLMWDEYSAFYYDLARDGSWTQTKSIGAYWALVADIVPEEQLPRFIEHLSNPSRFNRPHRVPSLSADHHGYRDNGDYWRGGVWAPTNYMVLRGLTRVGEDALAHEIALNHLDNVVKVYEETGTLWENYAPESAAVGKPAKPDFVGWTGLPPIAVLIEYIFGIRADMSNERIIWDVRLLDEHGIEDYPFGTDATVTLHCAARANADERPTITTSSNRPLTLELRWQDNIELMEIG